MTTVVLVIHLLVALALVGVVLLQRSEGGGLGMGGGSFGGMMSGRGTANLLTRTTAILATCFMVTSLLLAILASQARGPRSILDLDLPAARTGPDAPMAAPQVPAAAPSAPAAPAAPEAPAEPIGPVVPSAPVAN
ncbi:MAG TPA: preprotein translocase subunit SecG [Geminicoccaceae bacterium]|nr:preprotein translocase subunit SecG [Geminicoccaceae bacterium]